MANKQGSLHYPQKDFNKDVFKDLLFERENL
jgi:hypothetical protein